MEESQISVFDFTNKEDLMKKKEPDSRAEKDVADMIRGVPPRNILISFDDKPPKSLEEHIKEQQSKEKSPRRKRRDNMER